MPPSPQGEGFSRVACPCLLRNGKLQTDGLSDARWDGGRRSGRPTQEGGLNGTFAQTAFSEKIQIYTLLFHFPCI